MITRKAIIAYLIIPALLISSLIILMVAQETKAATAEDGSTVPDSFYSCYSVAYTENGRVGGTLNVSSYKAALKAQDVLKARGWDNTILYTYEDC